MTATLTEVCNMNFIVCKAGAHISSAIDIFQSQKSNPYIIIEKNNRFVGIISPQDIAVIIKQPDTYNQITCEEAIRTTAQVVTSVVNEDEILHLMIDKNLDYLVLVEDQKYHCIITPIDILKYNLLSDTKYQDDVKLENKLRRSEDKYHFQDIKEAIIFYKPVEPISIHLPLDDFINKLEKIPVKDCNPIYTEIFGLTKEDLINKQTLGDRIGKNETNLNMLNYIMKNNFRADNIETHEIVKNGQDIWFLNHTFFEIENECVVGLWSRKRNITEAKLLQHSLEKESQRYQIQFDEMFENNSDSMFIIAALPNKEYKFIRLNPMAESNIGLPHNSLIEKPLSELFPNETGQRMIASLNRCIRENKSIHLDIELAFPAGTKYFATTLVPIRCEKGVITQIMGVAVNITDRKRIEENLRRLNWALFALSNGNSAISRSTSEIELIQSCCESITNQNELYPVCCVLDVTDNVNQPIKIYTLSGNGHMIYYNQDMLSSEIPGQDCILKSVFSKNPEIQNINYQTKATSSNLPLQLLKENNIRSILAVPLASHDKVGFVLAIYSQVLDAFKDTEIRMFQELGQNIILGIEHRRTQTAYEGSLLVKEQQAIKLQNSLQNTITALGSMLEYRDPFTSGHQKRVADLAVAIAEEYGLDPERIHWLDLAACVHDIGKITVPSEILSKPYKLTAAEFALVKTHPEIGYQVLKDIEFPGPIAEIVHQHHEYLDGSGYPFGLKGNEIMLESKILTVADIVEAMASHRPYRPAFGVGIALNEIRKMRGLKLDPKAVDICILLFEKNNYHFPEVDHFNRRISLQRSDLSRSQR
ncbi:MAG: HD domain-containing protein [Gammaproteobacteria bacterium]|jgi:PAS domain S-box-containing protein/putative nucleotidyltransferase with HDIG domain|nr:HD domain-containing protein [Gammaproteobacteria bacterium]